ncbi:MAG: hypothetical protein IKT41_02470 [Clostridia bacterium]|nr:hypothetical protein [Clostridia bacterium]
MKNKFRKQNGSATMVVLIVVMFFSIFLISMYGYITNSEVSQLEHVAKMKSIYEKNINNLDVIYDKLMKESEMVPIYNLEQLKKIGSGENIIISNQIYNFSNDEQYRLMNDIEVDFADLPLESSTNFVGNLEGKNNTIIVKANENITADDIKIFKNGSATYTNLNIEIRILYTFEINATPSESIIKINGEEKASIEVEKGTSVTWKVSADGYVTQSGTEVINENTIKDIKLEKQIYTFAINASPTGAKVKINGEERTSIQVEVGSNVSWEVSLTGYNTQSGTEIVNGNITKNISLDKKIYTFTINPTPASAIVKINGEERKSIQIEDGSTVSWEVSLTGYNTQSGTEIINGNVTKNISLDKKIYTFTINPTPATATVKINGQARRTIEVEHGSTITWEVSCDEYYTKQGSLTLTNNENIGVVLDPWRYIAYSESFYFTACSDSAYSGIIGGGSATVRKYNVGGTNVSMGSFYIYESDIIKKIHSKATVSKVTLYFQFSQERNNTTLYTNRIKSSLYTGNTQKMSEQQTTESTKTVKQAQYALTNISRSDLTQGIRVDLKNYIEGTLEIVSTVKNMYCIIEGQKPDI